MSLAFDTRVGAYAVIVRENHLLLTHWNPHRPGFDGAWTLPGGGMEPGEQPVQTMIREVFEETGYAVELLGVDSYWMAPSQRFDGKDREYHAFRVLYTARVSSGDLVVEQNGSSDDCRWIPLDEVAALPRLDVVGRGLHMAGVLLDHVTLDPTDATSQGANVRRGQQ